MPTNPRGAPHRRWLAAKGRGTAVWWRRWAWRVALALGALTWVAVYARLVELSAKAQVPYCGPSLAQDRCVQLVRVKKYEWKRLLLEGRARRTWRVANGKHRRGIVVTGGMAEHAALERNVAQLRRLGCALPIEIWHNDDSSAKGFCSGLLERYGLVICRDLTEGGARVINSVAEARAWAVARSSFKKVLYLDADCLAMDDPTPLFDSQPFRETGAVFWRGPHDASSLLSGSTAKPNHVMWQLIDTPYNQSNRLHTTERGSGVLLVDKARHRDPLELAVIFLTDPFFEEAVGGNGRELVRFAWLALDRPFYMTDTPIFFLDADHSARAGLAPQLFCPKSIVLFAPEALLPSRAVGDEGPRPMFIHKSHSAGSPGGLDLLDRRGELALFSCDEHACDKRFECFLALPFPFSLLSALVPFVVPKSHLFPAYFPS